jgi:hypothetical protein
MASVPLSQVIAGAKRLVPATSDPDLRSALNAAAGALADKLHQLMETVKKHAEADGGAALEEVNLQLEAAVADLDAAQYAAQSGFLKPSPGVTRDKALAMLGYNVKEVLGAAEELMDVATIPNGRSFGDAGKKLAPVVAELAGALKAVAATSGDKPTQMNILTNGKKVVQDLLKLVPAARAVMTGDGASMEALNGSFRLIISMALVLLTNACYSLSDQFWKPSNRVCPVWEPKTSPTISSVPPSSSRM